MLEKAINVLRSSGTLIYPTDTVYGLGCDARKADAVAKLFALKNRENNKAVSVIGRRDVLEKICKIPDDAQPILDKFWPGALTGIFTANCNYSLDPRTLQNKTIAVRIPNHPFVLALLEHIDFPIISTSANLAGDPAPTKFSDIKIHADLNIEDDEFVKGTPSTLVDFRQKPYKILRQGDITI
ncbi:MAG: threonylcarbamoyl-AMP synthase [Alphaproteobacteria bacterium]|nr:threonylcarbamoyl-AMP synthase [Alphaproteobacteria bacterium]